MMNNPDNGNSRPVSVPVTWPELIVANRELLFQGLDALREIPAEIAGVEADEWNPYPVSESLLGASGMFAQAAMVYGPDSCREYWDVVFPIFPRALKEVEGEIVRDSRVVAASLVSLLNVAQCCGVELPAEIRQTAADVEQRWPHEFAKFREELSDRERWTVAFSALIANDMTTVQSMAGGGALEQSITTGEVFEFNVQGFIRYLAAAYMSGAELTDVLPALDNFIQHFPHKLAAGMLRWDDLMYAGRAVFSMIGKEPESSVASVMFALITESSLRGR
jgi:hypothetical protein